jgi:hypothetical protein
MGENIHRSLAAIAIAIALTAFLGWRSLRGTGLPAAPSPRSLPSPQLTQLMPYSQPLADTVGVLRLAHANVVLPRDPFGPPIVPQSSEISHGTQTADAPSEGPAPLRVTATMIAGTRRAAVINDMLVYVGDRVPGGGKLTSVERDRVVVTDPQGASHVVVVKEGDD